MSLCYIDSIRRYITFNSPEEHEVAQEFFNSNVSPALIQPYLDSIDGSFQTPTDLLDYVSSERYRVCLERSQRWYRQRARNERKIEVLGNIPILVVELLINYIEDNMLGKLDAWTSFTIPFWAKKTEGMDILKALSLSHRVFTIMAQRAIATTFYAVDLDVKEISYSPFCGPWVKNFTINFYLFPLDKRTGEKECFSFFWRYIIERAVNLTTLIINCVDLHDATFLLTQAVGRLGKLKFLKISGITPETKNTDHLAELCVCISKLKNLEYLWLESFKIAHKEDLARQTFTQLLLSTISSPPLLKTVVLDDFYCSTGYYLKWFLTSRGDDCVPTLILYGKTFCNPMLLPSLPPLRDLRLCRLPHFSSPDDEPTYLDGLLSTCPTLRSLYMTDPWAILTFHGILPPTLETLQVNFLDPHCSLETLEYLDEDLSEVIRRSYSVERMNGKGKNLLRISIIHRGLVHYRYVNLEEICREYDIQFEVVHQICAFRM